MRKAVLISFFILTSIFSIGCDDFLTGAVVSQRPEPVNVWCADGTALNVLDYCINEETRMMSILIANAGYGSIDSMEATFYYNNQQFERRIPRMNLEPLDSRVFQIPMFDIDGRFDMVHFDWFYSSGEAIRKCRRDLTLAYDEIRRCGE